MRTVRLGLRRLGRNERGAAAIEFSLIAPVFFGLLLSIVDVGRYMWTLNTMQYAIDQAVRAGVVQQLSEAEIEEEVRKSLTGIDANIAVTPGSSTLSITANATYAFLFPISSFMDSTTISLRTEMPK